ncbi:MAG: VanW family protein [Oscillospiraceae bacterium]|nr:VanW family protein [Oscillospiraceae bacterium]
MDNFDETRIGKDSMTDQNHEVSDATQRVWVDSDGRPTAAPVHRGTTSNHAQNPGAFPQRSPSGNNRSRRGSERKKQQERIAIIALCSIAAVMLIAVIVVIATMLLPSSSDDSIIRNNVYVAGVNLCGMNKEQAADALHKATDNTYPHLDMTVQVLNTELKLSPADTGARLNVDAVVEAALEYSRSNKNQNSTYAISVVDYLNLDTDYIQGALAELGKKYSTTLKQTTYEITGTQPPEGATGKDVDTTTVYQTLSIHVGTAEYSLNLSELYQQILDTYDSNLFNVTAICSVIAPDPLDYEALYAEYCYDPVNAVFNEENFSLISAEIYGYGFTVSQLKEAVENAEYGTTVNIPLCYLKPDIDQYFYANDVYQDILAIYETPLSDDSAWNTNLQKVCNVLNGTVIRAGEEFSFNNVVGEPTVKNGYQSAYVYIGRSYQKIVGGGISQAASTLYSCALMADLEIVERTNHSYVPTFINAGLDAEVYYGVSDLRFKNTTEKPIRIDAAVTGNTLRISLVGTDSKTYTVEITYEVTSTKKTDTVYTTMLENNPGGYKEGDVLFEGIDGCKISVYKCKYAKEGGDALSEALISASYYAVRDKVVVRIDSAGSSEDPTDPTDPNATEPSGPDSTASGNPSDSRGTA